MREVLEYYSQKIINSSILENLDLKKENILISSHREENIEDNENFEKFISLLSALEERYNLPIIVSTPKNQE